MNLLPSMTMGIVGVWCMIVGGLGWLVFLVWGTIRIRARKRGGWALTLFGLAWACFVGLGVLSTVSFVGRLGNYTDEKSFDPASYVGDTGVIAVPHQGECSLSLYLEPAAPSADPEAFSGQLQLSSNDGRFVVPTGNIGFFSTFGVAKTDEAGGKWKAEGSVNSLLGALEDVGIDQGEVLNLDVGPPFTAKVKTQRKAGGQVAMSLDIVGRDGCSYRISREDGGTTNTTPSFQVLAADGTVLWEEKMEYG